MARCTRYLAALLLLIAVPAHAESLKVTKPERVGMSSAKLQELRDYFQKQVSDGLEPGFQVVVARRGRVVMHENMGYMDVRTREPITYDTLFRIMSLTKPVTNVAAMILYEEGRFSLDDPIAKYIPELADLTVYAGTNDAGERILEPPRHAPTMHELMTHTAGFTYGGPTAARPSTKSINSSSHSSTASAGRKLSTGSRAFRWRTSRAPNTYTAIRRTSSESLSRVSPAPTWELSCRNVFSVHWAWMKP